MKTDATLSRDLVDLAISVNRIVNQEFKSDGKVLGLTQFRMLHKIKEGVRHVGKLSEAFGISQPATSILVNTMVKAGFLKRIPHLTDRRQIELHLTAKGTSDLDKSYRRAFKTIEQRLLPISASRRNAIANQIRELSALLAEVEG